MAVEPLAYNEVTSFVFEQTDNGASEETALLEMEDGGTIFVSSVMAEKYGLSPGDSLDLFTKTGKRPFVIGAVVVDFYNNGLVIDGSWADMRRHFRLNDANAYMVKVNEETSVDAVKADIDDLFGDRYHLIVESNLAIQERVNVLMDQAYSMFDVLALIAMVVAFLGITNTLTMNVMERIREIGMLRSIGMSRGQVILMVLAEAGLMGVIGGIVGVIFGILLSRIFLLSMTAMSGYKLEFILPISRVIMGFLIAVVIAHIAAVFPANRAAKVDIMEAIHQE